MTNKEVWQQYPREIQAVLFILLVKIAVLILLPITGDEAYFVKWGSQLAMGYYDHPPMVGWLIYAMNFISTDVIFYRLFSVLTTFVLAYIIYLFANKFTSPEKSFYVAMLFLVSPIDLLILLFTNDIPLVLFGTIGSYLFIRALEDNSWKLSLAAGLFLGLAFLSKYFIIFLVFSLFVYAVLSYRTKSIKTLLLTALVMLPLIAQNLYFNYNCCWNNIMFNFIARPQSSYNPTATALFFGLILYLMTPWGLWALFKTKFQRDKLLVFILTIFIVVLPLFFIVSLKNFVGLHWFLLFLPYMFLFFIYVDDNRLKKLFAYNFIFSLIHGALLLTILLLPISAFKNSGNYSSIVYGFKPQPVCEAMEDYADGSLFTSDYTSAAVLSYQCKRDIKMIFNRSKFGRLDDKLLNVQTLDQKDITVFSHREVDTSEQNEFLQVCQGIEVSSLNIEQTSLYFVSCKQFNYLKYKALYLDTIRQKFYNIPDWLPKGQCYFDEYYGAAQ